MNRESVVKLFSKYMKSEKNCEIYEKSIFSRCDSEPEKYKWCVYQILGLFMQGGDYKAVMADIKSNKIGWNSKQYEQKQMEIHEHDDYIVNPFDIVEGVSECGKCGSKKTWNVQKQIRSGDEPMTTFSKCAGCGNEWTYSG
jgi:DNA-directed RNA polymerase subunit M/transcription elongation factor TFIIS